MTATVTDRARAMAKVPPESPLEATMARILEDGPGTGCRSAFLLAEDWREAMRLVRDTPEVLLRSPVLVVPQAAVLRHRADFMVIAGGPGGPGGRRLGPPHAFFVECDGAEFHGPARLADDVRRERAVRKETGMDVLRFSGGEISFHPDQVSTVLGAMTEAAWAVCELGRDRLSESVGAVERSVRSMTAHPLLRAAYGSRNARPSADPYDHLDPSGTAWDRDTARSLAAWDPFLRLATARAELRHAVARLRQEEQAHPAEAWDDMETSTGSWWRPGSETIRPGATARA